MLLASEVAGGGRRPELGCTGGASRYPRILRAGRGGRGGESSRGDSVARPRPHREPTQPRRSPPLRAALAASGVAGDCKMADGRDDAADQLKQWKSSRGSQVPAGRGCSPVTPVPLMPRGARSPEVAVEGEAPWPLPGLAPMAWSRSREQRRDGGCQLALSDKGGQRCPAPAAPPGQRWDCAVPEPRAEMVVIFSAFKSGICRSVRCHGGKAQWKCD